MNLIARYGPAPEDTETSAGVLDTSLSHVSVIQLSESEAKHLTAIPNELYKIAATIWREVTSQGFGHLLIGTHSGFKYLTPTGISCGQESSEVADLEFAPSNYKLLFSVARARRPAEVSSDAPPYLDFAIDYRTVEGPGDPNIRPSIFAPEASEEPETLESPD